MSEELEVGKCKICGKSIRKFDNGWHHVYGIAAKKHITVVRFPREGHVAEPEVS